MLINNTSTQVYASCLKRKSEFLKKELSESNNSVLKKLLKSLQDTTLGQKAFTTLSDGLCGNEFWLCVTQYNEYGKEIALEVDVDCFV